MADNGANEVIGDIIKDLERAERAYKRVDKAEDLPDAFHHVSKRFGLAKDTFRIVRARPVEHSNHDDILYQEMESCEHKARNILVLFNELVPSGNEPRLERYRKLAKGLGGVGKNKVEILMKELLVAIKSLMVGKDGSAFAMVGKDQIEELAKAIEELSAMPQSLSEDAPEGVFNNWKGGTQNVMSGWRVQNNNTSTGRQYNNASSGRQYNAETQNFGKQH